METTQTTPSDSQRAWLGGATVAAAGLLAALALVFTNATGVTEVADDARLQQQVESVLGSTIAARTGIGQALLIASAFGDDTATSIAIDEAEALIADLEQRTAALSGLLDDPGLIDASLDEALVEGRSVLEAIVDSDLPRAAALAAGPAAAAFESLSDSLVEQRDAVALRIVEAAGQSSTVATASRFMVAFVVPTIAVVVVLAGTRRRRKREALAIALAHERQVNRSKDQLIANLSHELRTPLTGIYTAALALDDTGFAEPAVATELNSMIIEQSADLTRMVEDLLVSAQADAGRLRFDLEPIPIVDVMRGVETEFSRADVAIGFDLEPAIVLVDSGRLRQILRNLLSNAIRYGGDGVEVVGRLHDDRYVVAVSDDGPGVPPDIEERLFERFVHQGDRPLLVGSVGLGLAISRVLARGMRGHIDYRRSDERTIFEVSLALSTPEPEELPPDPLPEEAPHLVDDEAHVEG